MTNTGICVSATAEATLDGLEYAIAENLEWEF